MPGVAKLRGENSGDRENPAISVLNLQQVCGSILCLLYQKEAQQTKITTAVKCHCVFDI